MTQSDLKVNIKKLIVYVTGIDNDQVVPQDDNYERPDGLYVTYNIDDDTTIGNYIKEDPDKTTRIATTHSVNRATVSLNCYQSGANSFLKDFSIDMNKDANRLYIKNNFNMTILEPLNVQNLTFLQEQRYVERGLLTLNIEYIDTFTETLSTIDTVVSEFNLEV